MIIRGTTPTIEITTDISLVPATQVYVSLKQGKTKDKALPVIERTKDSFETITDEGFTFKLTQEETLKLQADTYATLWQIRAIFPDGTAVACLIDKVNIADIIKEGVI